MPPRRRPPPTGPRLRPGDLILLRKDNRADLLIIWSIQHLPQESIQVLGWNRIRNSQQHVFRLTRALTSNFVSAEECVRIFRDVVVRPLMRNPQTRHLVELQDLGQVIGDGGDAVFDPRPQAVRKVLNGDRCHITFCRDGCIHCGIPEFERR